jgi:hypothetical protein
VLLNITLSPYAIGSDSYFPVMVDGGGAQVGLQRW